MTDSNVQYVTLHNDERDVPRVGIVATTIRGASTTVHVFWLDNDGATYESAEVSDLVPVTMILTGDGPESVEV